MTYWGDDAEDKVAVWKSFEGLTLECSGGSDQTEKSHGCQNFERINQEMTCTKNFNKRIRAEIHPDQNQITLEVLQKETNQIVLVKIIWMVWLSDSVYV